MKKIPNIHPGEILNEEFLKPLDISQNKLAKEIKVSPRRINEIVNAKRGITADTAIRLSIYFGTTPEFWMNLQSFYELRAEQAKMPNSVKKAIKPLKQAAS